MARAGGHESLVSSVKAFELYPKAKGEALKQMT